jgi:hypothetical protein
MVVGTVHPSARAAGKGVLSFMAGFVEPLGRHRPGSRRNMSTRTEESAGVRRGLACLLVLLAGLTLAAGLLYFLGRVFARWFADE